MYEPLNFYSALRGDEFNPNVLHFKMVKSSIRFGGRILGFKLGTLMNKKNDLT